MKAYRVWNVRRAEYYQYRRRAAPLASDLLVWVQICAELNVSDIYGRRRHVKVLVNRGGHTTLLRLVFAACSKTKVSLILQVCRHS